MYTAVALPTVNNNNNTASALSHIPFTSDTLPTPTHHTGTGNQQRDLKILPLGASATYGTGSSTLNGYREELRVLLEYPMSSPSSPNPVSIQIDFVGSLTSGAMSDPQNEGHRGLEIAEIREKAKIAIPKYDPDIVLVLAGTNDCVRDTDVSRAGERMEALLDLIEEVSDGRATAVVATLQPHADKEVDGRVDEVNKQYRKLVRTIDDERRGSGQDKTLPQQQQHGGKQRRRRSEVYLAETRKGEYAMSRDEDLADGLHPNDKGYAKMARAWEAAIRKAVKENESR